MLTASLCCVVQVEALKLFSKLANPLAAMHSQNIFHCDLSTNNIVLEEGKLDQPHIIDLGMATVNGRKLTTGLEDVVSAVRLLLGCLTGL